MLTCILQQRKRLGVYNPEAFDVPHPRSEVYALKAMVPAARWPSRLAASFYRADRNAMASTTSHPVMTSAATAPAVIFAFSFVV